ncbi:MAG TPA: UPF0280 family protein [Dehalococcoidia bacterium]|nr:UPF0280 family protein [Dehalococcoidia bacterium]
MAEARTYRRWVEAGDLVAFNVTVRETDLHIRASADLSKEALRAVKKYRAILEIYIKRHPQFLTSLKPVAVASDAPEMVAAMSRAAERVGVGPMATVAGAIAEFVGQDLLAFSPEVIVENGGDIYLKSLRERVVAIYAGRSPLTGKIGLKVKAAATPLGICTSSGTVGHSLSYGQADAAVVLAESASLADAAATAIGNRVVNADDIPRAIEFAQTIGDLVGVVIVKDDRVGAWGGVELCQLSV